MYSRLNSPACAQTHVSLHKHTKQMRAESAVKPVHTIECPVSFLACNLEKNVVLTLFIMQFFMGEHCWNSLSRRSMLLTCFADLRQVHVSNQYQIYVFISFVVVRSFCITQKIKVFTVAVHYILHTTTEHVPQSYIYFIILLTFVTYY